MNLRLIFAVVIAIAGARGSAAQTLHDCLMDPAEVVAVGSSATGILETLSVRRGDQVKKGDLIGYLQSDLEVATVNLLRTRAESTQLIETQQAQLDLLNRRVDRVRSLRERAVVTEEALEVIESERLAVQSLLAQAEINRELASIEQVRAEIALAQREIRSPLDGVVLEVGRSAGEHLDTRDHVVKIGKLDPLHVEVFLPIDLFGSIKVGDVATVRPAPPLDGNHSAQVISIDSIFDAASGTFGVRLEMSNPQTAIPGGHRCLVAFQNS